MNVEQAEPEQTLDDWIASLLDSPSPSQQPEPPSNDTCNPLNTSNALNHNIQPPQDLDTTLPVPPAHFSINPSQANNLDPLQNHSTNPFRSLPTSAPQINSAQSQTSSEGSNSGSRTGPREENVGLSQMLELLFREGLRCGTGLFHFVCKNRRANGASPSRFDLDRGVAAFLSGMNRSGVGLPFAPNPAANVLVKQQERILGVAQAIKPLTPIERNIQAFNADQRVQKFVSEVSNAAELSTKIRNWDAPFKDLGRGGYVLAGNLIDQSGESSFSASRSKESPEEPLSDAERTARKNWRELLKVLNQGVLLFLEKGRKWEQQVQGAREAAIKFLEIKVEATRFCRDHQRAIALWNHGLSLTRGKEDWIEFEAWMLPDEPTKRVREEESSDSSGEEAIEVSQATKKQRVEETNLLDDWSFVQGTSS